MAAVEATILVAHTCRSSISWRFVALPVPLANDNQKLAGIDGNVTLAPSAVLRFDIRLK